MDHSVRITDSGNEHAAIRPRSIIANPHQKKLLEAAFAQNSKPSKKDVEELCKTLGLTEKWVSSWFMRQRGKQRQPPRVHVRRNHDQMTVANTKYDDFQCSENQEQPIVESLTRILRAGLEQQQVAGQLAETLYREQEQPPNLGPLADALKVALNDQSIAGLLSPSLPAAPDHRPVVAQLLQCLQSIEQSDSVSSHGSLSPPSVSSQTSNSQPPRNGFIMDVLRFRPGYQAADSYTADPSTSPSGPPRAPHSQPSVSPTAIDFFIGPSGRVYPNTTVSMPTPVSMLCSVPLSMRRLHASVDDNSKDAPDGQSKGGNSPPSRQSGIPIVPQGRTIYDAKLEKHSRHTPPSAAAKSVNLVSREQVTDQKTTVNEDAHSVRHGSVHPSDPVSSGRFAFTASTMSYPADTPRDHRSKESLSAAAKNRPVEPGSWLSAKSDIATELDPFQAALLLVNLKKEGRGS